MSQNQGNQKPRIWQIGWWVPNLKKSDRQDCCQRVADSSAPTASYYVLIVLSTLIASYGLLSNSTATVIGAMIVAPLMGPILGLALGSILSDSRMFRRSLVAEATGVVLVILTGLSVAVLVGPSHIDFASSEVMGRVRPTLFDFAIGLAAGLAGAYCTVHPGLQSSVAGVAIAVALVPPLAVTGLTGAGWLTGNLEFRPVFGSFMLFFTNLLTIELASVMVFVATGFRKTRDGKQDAFWRKTWIVKAVLLIMTGWFLTVQLTTLLQERLGLTASRNELKSMLLDIPGAQLDSVEAHLLKNTLTVSAVIGSRTDIEPPTVARFEKRIAKKVHDGLPNVKVRLVVRTVNSTYASSTRYLFEPTDTGLSDEERRGQALDVKLGELIEEFPGVELVNFQASSKPSKSNDHRSTPLNVTISTPYAFDPRMVKGFQDDLNRALSKDPLFAGYTYKLLVKSVIVRSTTSEDSVAIQPPEFLTGSEKEALKREQRYRQLLTSALQMSTDLEITEMHIRRIAPVDKHSTTPVVAQPSATPALASPSATPEATPSSATPALASPSATPEATPSSATPALASPSATPAVAPPSATPAGVQPTPVGLAQEGPAKIDAYDILLELRSSRLVGTDLLAQARNTANELYTRETGYEVQLTLMTKTTVGNDLLLDDSTATVELAGDEVSREDQLNQKLSQTLNSLVEKVPGAVLGQDTDLQQVGGGEDYRMMVVITSPKPLENKSIMAWQEALLASEPGINSLELRIENRLGRTLRMTPSRRALPPRPPLPSRE